jgi:hypothetical protein
MATESSTISNLKFQDFKCEANAKSKKPAGCRRYSGKAKAKEPARRRHSIEIGGQALRKCSADDGVLQGKGQGVEVDCAGEDFFFLK